MVKDAYSLPRIDKYLESLSGTKMFASLDLKNRYWHVEVDEESKPLTAFTIGPLGFHECKRMPFGLPNVPMTFERLMEMCLGELHLSWCIIYLDNIIFLKTPKEHFQHLTVFQKLAEAGLKLKPSKYDFFHKCIMYLGQVVSHEGIKTDPKKITAITNWLKPVTVTDAYSFLSFTNHYYHFIHCHAQIACLLNLLTTGEKTNKKKKSVDWTSECDMAFEKLKSLCSSTLI